MYVCDIVCVQLLCIKWHRIDVLAELAPGGAQESVHTEPAVSGTAPKLVHATVGMSAFGSAESAFSEVEGEGEGGQEQEAEESGDESSSSVYSVYSICSSDVTSDTPEDVDRQDATAVTVGPAQSTCRDFHLFHLIYFTLF